MTAGRSGTADLTDIAGHLATAPQALIAGRLGTVGPLRADLAAGVDLAAAADRGEFRVVDCCVPRRSTLCRALHFWILYV